MPNQYAPTDSSPRALKEHAKRTADHLALTSDQASYLVAEIRNAISPLAMAIECLPECGPEDIEDMKGSLQRILFLMDAIANRA